MSEACRSTNGSIDLAAARTAPIHLEVLIMSLAVGLRAAIVLAQDGVLYPDEVHQSLEQAHRLLWHAGFVPWEWSLGARHPLFVWVLEGAFWLGERLGLPPHLAGRLLLALASGLTTLPLMRLVQRLGASRHAGLAAGLVWAVSSWSLLLGPRALTESAVTLPLVGGLLLVLQATWRSRLMGALLLSVAVMLRLQLALIPLVLLASDALRLRGRALAQLTAGFAVGALVFGAGDALFWGEWFHSAREYWSFNFVQGRAAEFGTEPPTYYLRAATTALAGSGLLLLAGLWAWRRAPWLLACMVVFVAAHLAIPHKELRFLYPVLPLACAAFGLALDGAVARFGVRTYWVLVLLVLQVPPWKMTFSMAGIPSMAASAPVWDAGGSVNRLLRVAGRTPGVCGVLLRDFELGFSGSYAYFHATAPLFDSRQVPPGDDAWNVVLSKQPGERVLAADGAFYLVQTRPTCTSYPIDWALR